MSDVHLNHPQTRISSLKNALSPRRRRIFRHRGVISAGGKAAVLHPLYCVFIPTHARAHGASTGVIVVRDGTLSRGCSHHHRAITRAPGGADKNTPRMNSAAPVMAARLPPAHIKQTRGGGGGGEYRSPPYSRAHAASSVLGRPVTFGPPPPSPHHGGRQGPSSGARAELFAAFPSFSIKTCRFREKRQLLPRLEEAQIPVFEAPLPAAASNLQGSDSKGNKTIREAERSPRPFCQAEISTRPLKASSERSAGLVDDISSKHAARLRPCTAPQPLHLLNGSI